MDGRTKGAPALSAALVFAIFAAGCASMFMKGGSLAPAGYQPQKVLVTYRADGAVPAGATYLLVLTEKGEAVFERGSDGSGALFDGLGVAHAASSWFTS